MNTKSICKCIIIYLYEYVNTYVIIFNSYLKYMIKISYRFVHHLNIFILKADKYYNNSLCFSIGNCINTLFIIYVKMYAVFMYIK
jgi:hypothetical protein